MDLELNVFISSQSIDFEGGGNFTSSTHGDYALESLQIAAGFVLQRNDRFAKLDDCKADTLIDSGKLFESLV